MFRLGLLYSLQITAIIANTFKEDLKFLNRLYDTTLFRAVYA